jgi:hypothetical protein
MPAQAQMDDGELPKIDFSVNLAQHAQFVTFSEIDEAGEANTPNAGLAADPDASFAFQRIRAGLTSSVQFSENVSGILMLQQEPNDFGFNTTTPAVDFAVLNLQVTPELTVQGGTIVTGLQNFRGYSDGPAVQGNPLVLNSAADMITAGQGVKLIGSYGNFGFDATIARGFGGAATSVDPSDTDESGVELIGKFRYTGSDMFKVGAGAAVGTGRTDLNFTGGDGDNVDLSDAVAGQADPEADDVVGLDDNGNPAAVDPTSSGSPTRGVQNMPGEFAVHGDAKVMLGGADIDGWVGYTTADTQNDNTAAALFGGLGVKFDVNDQFYIAGRGTVVSDQSDDAIIGNDPDKVLTRIQGGIGYEVYNKALLKVEGFTQSHGETRISRPSPIDSFSGVITELSFNF